MNGYKKEHKNGYEVLKFEHGSRKITTRNQLNRKKKFEEKNDKKMEEVSSSYAARVICLV